MKNKKEGISIIILVIIILVIGMLTSMIVISTKGMLQETDAREFASELKQLEYLVKQSKILNDNENLNFVGRTIAVSDLSSEQKKQMREEIGEGATQITLYEIDYDAVDVASTMYGKKANEDENDVYVVSNTTGKVYYLKGYKWEGKTYYTLTSELNKLLSI